MSNTNLASTNRLNNHTRVVVGEDGGEDGGDTEDAHIEYTKITSSTRVNTRNNHSSYKEITYSSVQG